jgi:UDP-N-acetylmuramoyl-L-alanyl-D-glutamate--2,6-diaminopimelate ligase
MTLSEILERIACFQENLSYTILQGKQALHLQDIKIDGINSDSRLVQKGEIFGVFSPDAKHAIQHIEQAVSRGVNVMVISSGIMNRIKDTAYFDNVIWIMCDRPRQVMAKLTSRFYGTHPQNCVAVTGTAGKTSVCSLVLQLWKHLNIPSASIGTLGLHHSTEDLVMEYTSTLTTPDPVSMHKCLAELKQRGTDHVIMEASSHGLDQYRLDGLRFKVAAFTSFSQDHLDYHPTMEHYFAAKRRLFEDLIAKDGWAVLNADIPEYDALVDVCVLRNHPFYSYGKSGNFIKLKSMNINKGGQTLSLQIDKTEYVVQFPLMGSTQVYNLMCAMAIVITMGAKTATVLKAVERITPVPGRLTFAGQHPNGALIYVDYAHKPEALELVLSDMRHYCKGHLHVVFGCGGDRDKDKRSIMGRIASEKADFVVVTDDNPRTESSAHIRQQIMEGCPDAVEIGDRKMAIDSAIKNLEANDILIVAGKGHEKHQIIGTEKIPFDDMEVVHDCVTRLAGKV